MPVSLAHKHDPLRVVTVVDKCHSNLEKVQILVHRTVDMHAVNVCRQINGLARMQEEQPTVTPMVPALRAVTVGHLNHRITEAEEPTLVAQSKVARTLAVTLVQASRSEALRNPKSDLYYLPFIDNSLRQFSINRYFREWAHEETRCVPVILGSVMAKLCYITTLSTNIVLVTVANTVVTVQDINKSDITIVLDGQHGKHMTVRCCVLVNSWKTSKVMLGQEVLRVAR